MFIKDEDKGNNIENVLEDSLIEKEAYLEKVQYILKLKGQLEDAK